MQSALQILYSYWNEVRAGRIAPQRLEIEPSRISAILSQTFMLEVLKAGTYPYRLAGTRLCEIFGSELRGKNFLDGWSEQDRRALASGLATIGEQGAVAHLILEGVIDARHRVELEVNLLPLLHGGKITRIIGALCITSAPHWLGSEPLRGIRVKQHRQIWPDGRPRASQAPSVPSPATPDARAPKADPRRFRVVEGGRASGKYDKR
ncbi:MAG: PAS domain-containing protein [Hyphomicrobiaceae bacterium]|nr:PAS domain-containing protein [Hyphomicrobiaceae bacterium]